MSVKERLAAMKAKEAEKAVQAQSSPQNRISAKMTPPAFALRSPSAAAEAVPSIPSVDEKNVDCAGQENGLIPPPAEVSKSETSPSTGGKGGGRVAALAAGKV